MPTLPDTSASPSTFQEMQSRVSHVALTPFTSIKHKLKLGISKWTKFWFEPADPLMLSVIRLFTAGMLFYNLCVWTLDFNAFFSANGLQPLDTIRSLYKGTPVFSFWFYVPEPWLWTAHLACLAIVFMFFTGSATRVTSVLSYLITISYSQRVPIANFGLDQILGLLCLYLAVGPSGACLSTDGLFRKWRNQKRIGIAATNESILKLKSSSATVSLRLIQIHLCVIYFWAGFAKLKGDTWFTGEAMWNVIANLEYQTTDLTWMAHVPWLPYLVAHITVIWELFFCVLVWNRTLRPLVLLVGTGMHFGIGAFLGMWTFGLAMTFCYFAFSNPAVWRHTWNRLFSHGRPRGDEKDHSFEQVAVAEPALPAAELASQPYRSPSMTNSSSAIVTKTMASEFHSPSMPIATSPPPSTPNPDRPLPKTKQGSIQGLPGTELLIVALRERHRKALHNYFQNHSVPCRSSATVDSSKLMTDAVPPAAILVMGSELSSHQLIRLLQDLPSDESIPIMAVVSEKQMVDIQHHRFEVSFLLAPVTLKEIHEELIQTMWKGRDGFTQKTQTPNHTD